MSDNSNGSNGSMVRGALVAFAAGAAVGAGLALLYAPQSGKETRQLLRKKTRELKDAAGHTIDRIKGRVHEAMVQDSESAHGMVDDPTGST